MEDLFDDDTMDFIQLWDYVQNSKISHRAIQPEDVVLMDELVQAHNFSIALDMLRQRLKPYLTLLPVELADIARRRPKCIKVQPQLFQHPGPTDFMGLPPPPVSLSDPVQKTVETTPESDQGDDLEQALWHDWQEQSNQERIRTREQQDHEYLEALIADADASLPTAAPDEETVDSFPDFFIGNVSDPVVVLVQVADGRYQGTFSQSDHTVQDVKSWMSGKLQRDFQSATLWTNYPKTSWDSFSSLSQLPIEGGRLMVFLETT